MVQLICSICIVAIIWGLIFLLFNLMSFKCGEISYEKFTRRHYIYGGIIIFGIIVGSILGGLL